MARMNIERVVIRRDIKISPGGAWPADRVVRA